MLVELCQALGLVGCDSCAATDEFVRSVHDHIKADQHCVFKAREIDPVQVLLKLSIHLLQDVRKYADPWVKQLADGYKLRGDTTLVKHLLDILFISRFTEYHHYNLDIFRINV